MNRQLAEKNRHNQTWKLEATYFEIHKKTRRRQLVTSWDLRSCCKWVLILMAWAIKPSRGYIKCGSFSEDVRAFPLASVFHAISHVHCHAWSMHDQLFVSDAWPIRSERSDDDWYDNPSLSLCSFYMNKHFLPGCLWCSINAPNHRIHYAIMHQ